MTRDDRLWIAGVAAVLLTLAAGCGKGGSATGPSEPLEAPPAPQRAAELPPSLYGAFTASADVSEAATHGGNVVLVLPSYADDAREVAAALRAGGKVAILSTHHVFGGPESGWAAGLERTLAWAEPFADRIVAIYVVDEPLSWGMKRDALDRAVAAVRGRGFKTMVAETVEIANRRDYVRPAVDLFGTTCYDWPGVGSWSLDRCEVAYASHPDWNVAIGQGFDWHKRSGSVGSQMARWAAIGRQRQGVVFWVWAWPRQTGIRDDAEALAAYHKGAGW